MFLFAVSDAVLISTVTAVFSFLGMVFTGMLGYYTQKLNVKVNDVATKVTEGEVALSKQIEVIHKATNGMKDELVAEVRKASFAQGVKSETDKAPE